MVEEARHLGGDPDPAEHEVSRLTWDFEGNSRKDVHNSGWENTTSSLEVKGGTWRLYQLPNFDRMGWYVDVAGEDLIHEASESGGWTNDDLSSIELLSADVERPAWAILKRKRR